jgi:hypothetical protein
MRNSKTVRSDDSLDDKTREVLNAIYERLSAEGFSVHGWCRQHGLSYQAFRRIRNSGIYPITPAKQRLLASFGFEVLVGTGD